MTDQQDFEVFAISNAGWSHPGIAVAAARAGGTGVLDLEFCDDDTQAANNLRRLCEATDGDIGLRITSAQQGLAARLLASIPKRTLTLVLSGAPENFADMAKTLRRDSDRVVAEITDAADVDALNFTPDAIMAKGHEAGGWVGVDTSYILVQKLAARTELPVIVRGGIGLRSAAACRVAGAVGVLLDDQVLLLDESPLPASLKGMLSRLNGSETKLFGELIDHPLRAYSKPGCAALEAAGTQTRAAEAGEIEAQAWHAGIQTLVGWGEGQLIPVGQGIGVAPALTKQYPRVGKLVAAIRRSSAELITQAAALKHLSPESSMAVSHGTRYPLVQGPMTRVSDSADFTKAVADNGALPFLALALMRGEQVQTLLAETRAKLGDQAWGVGILGFVPQKLRDEQIAAIWEHKPPFALIAGGRPDQAAEFEERGIPAYIHAPAPALLRMYLEQGAKRFVFEGRECGGHIGPLSSFALWEQMIDVLLTDVSTADAKHVHVLFAGGINDALSSAMLAALTAPLAARGMQVGALMGSAYLFTDEIVAANAVVSGFQQQALACHRTMSLETGPGHSTRCSDTQFAHDFYARRRELLRSDASAEDIRDELEDLNLGRLRMASKGRTRDEAGELIDVGPEQQLTDGMYMIGQVATLHDKTWPIQELHENVTTGAQSILDKSLARTDNHNVEDPKPCDIAIIGIGMLVPGADNVGMFWDNVLNKANSITEVPKARWDWRMYYDPDPAARDKVYSKWGGFLPEMPFNPFEYGIAPISMKSIDPMQLLALEACSRSLRDAGLRDGNFDRENTSVILGAGGGLGDLGMQYGVRAELPRFVENPDDAAWDRLPEWTNETFSGSLQNVAAGRIANRLDLGGLNFTVDAACGSSLAAVTLACQELAAGRSNVALAGGVDTVNGPFGYLCFSKTQAFSPKGIPRAFDKNADGIVISEGVAVVTLKRLADARRDGDRVYATIKAVAGSSDGKALGMTAPRPEGQVLALNRAYARAGFSPATVDLIEAHGTGTPVGDRAEAETITRALKEQQAMPKSVAIGSVKTILGHTKCAAGVTGLIKTALSLHHRVLPAHVGVDDPIDAIGADDSPVYLLKDSRPWLTPEGRPRRGAVSAFGFGGTNFHAVLEEYRDEFSQREVAGSPNWPFELCLFRATDQASLKETIGRMVTALRQDTDVSLANIAYSLAQAAAKQGRQPLCLAFAAKSLEGLANDLDLVLAHLDQGKPLPPYIMYSHSVPEQAPELGFLFPGQGSQFVNMGAPASLFLEELRAGVELANQLLAKQLERPLAQVMWPPAAFGDAAEATQTAQLTDTRYAQPAIGALEVGYHRLAKRLGLHASGAAGHSYGEYAALMAAGVINEEEFLNLSAVRGRSMADAGEHSQAGAMAAVTADRITVEKHLEGFADVLVANHNAPQQSVISGPAEQVQYASDAMQAAGIQVKALSVSSAFHTEIVAAAQEPLSKAIASAEVKSPAYPVYSNTLGARYPEDPAQIRETLNRHMLSPVEFVSEIETMYADGIRVFLELGPKSVVSKMASATLAEHGDAHAISLDGHGGGMRGFITALAELLVAGIELDLEAVFASRPLTALNLAKLAELVKPDIPKTSWYISGGCSRPLDDPSLRTGKQPAMDKEAKDAALAKAAALHAGQQTAPSATAQATSAPPLQTAAPSANPTSASTSAASSEALTAYHETMRQFLSLQERVMGQFLNADNTAHAPQQAVAPQAVPVAQPVAAQQAPAPPQVAVPQVESAAPPNTVTTAAPTMDYRATLLGLVAERTGYPEEMLSTDADLEADLGIDSIKRVEIVGSFQKMLPDAVGEAMQNNMEAFARAKTLDAMLQQLAEIAPAQDQAQAQGQIQPNSQAQPDEAPIDYQAALLALVAERTGYPEEMLGVDADLEADLGIDSIKRVEIVGSFQKQLPAAIGQAMQDNMEAFARAKTLNAILEQLRVIAPAVSASAPQAAAQAASVAVDIDYQATLLALVAERTGYPEEMLAMDADLEADLGIDSIKRVEIVGSFQKQLPVALGQAMQDNMEAFARAKTLNGVLEQLRAASTGTAPAVSEKAVSSAGEKTPALELTTNLDNASSNSDAQAPTRSVIRSQAALLPDEKIIPSGLILLAGGDLAIRTALTEQLQKSGVNAVTIEAVDADGLAKEINNAREQHGAVSGLIFMHGLDAANDVTLADWQASGQRCVLALFHMIKILGADVQSLRLIAASRLGGKFARDADGVASPLAGGASGFIKCLRYEYPESVARAVDFDGQDDASIAALLLNEYCSDDELEECGYTGDARHGTITVAEPLAETRFSPQLQPTADWVVLATGGARGITADILAEMVCSDMTLVLLGRSPEPAPESADTADITDPSALKKALLNAAKVRGETPKLLDLERAYNKLTSAREITANLARLRAAGANVEYHSVDVCDEAAFGNLIDGVYARHNRIDAVLHGAGVIEDKLIADKSIDSFARVLRTKVDSAWVISQKIKPESLKLMAFFTSVAGRYGNAGQADYAAANESINRLAWHLARAWPDARVVAQNWGPWDAGMASEGVKAQFRERGVTPISVEQGARYFIEEMALGPKHEVEVVIGDGPWVSKPAASEPQHQQPTFPLIRDNLRMGAGGALLLDHRFTLETDAYLGDHVLDGKAVLPATAAAEWIAQVAAAGWPGWQVAEVSGLRVLAGIILDEHNGCQVQFKAKAATHSDIGEQRVSVDITQADRKAPAYRATVLLVQRLEEPPMYSGEAVDGPSLDPVQIYRDYLFHGPRFHLLEKIQAQTEAGIDAQARPSRVSDWLNTQGHWLLDPGLLDCGPQLALVWARIHRDASALPSAFGALRRYGREPLTEPLQLALRFQTAPYEGGLLYDVAFVDAQGRIRLEMRDVEGTASTSLNRLAAK